MKARFILALLCLSSLAYARQAPAPIIPRLTTYRVSLEPLVVLPGGQTQVGREREIGEGDVVMETGLAYPNVAVLGAPIDIVIAGEHIVAPAGRGALEADAHGGALAGLRGARVFCLFPHWPHQPPHDIQYRQDFGARFPNRTAQACFVDQDRDMRFDFAFLSGTNWPEDREPVSLDHVPYVTRTDERLPASRLSIVLARGGLLRGMQLECQVMLTGDQLPLQRVRLMSDAGRPSWFNVQQGVGGSNPHPVSYGRARIDVLSYDSDAHRARVSVAAPFERSELQFEFIQNVITVYVAR